MARCSGSKGISCRGFQRALTLSEGAIWQRGKISREFIRRTFWIGMTSRMWTTRSLARIDDSGMEAGNVIGFGSVDLGRQHSD
ncbi:hypothetical protein V6N13_013669 [Hibiscus sabdariffa]